MNKIILLLSFCPLFLLTCDKERLDGNKTYIRGHILEYGSEAPLPNVAIYLQDCHGEVLGGITCTTIDTFYTDSKGKYDYEFEHDPIGNYYCQIEKEVEGYFQIEGFAINHGLNEFTRYADPYAWLKLHVKNVNPVNENDKIRFTYEYKPGTWEDLLGTEVDSSFFWRVRGSYESYLIWKVTKDDITIENRDNLLIPAQDTLYYEILY